MSTIARLVCSILLLYACCQEISGQLRYPIAGTYKEKDAQGMAIHGKYAYLMSSGGLCRQYDLESKLVVKEFFLASSAKDNHVNSVCFGVENTGQANIPVIYIGECKYGARCFVEDLSGDAPKLVQTIKSTHNGKIDPVVSWAVDVKHRHIYSIARGKAVDEAGNVINTISQYRLPELEEGSEVTLTEKDLLSRFEVIFPNIIQGCKINGKYLYIVTGLQETQSHRQDAVRAIQVINLEENNLKKKIDLTYVTTNEPEDIDFYKGKCLLYCGQEGGLYQIRL